MSEWQPIETAPRDEIVLLYGLTAGEISGVSDEPAICIGSRTGKGNYPGFEWACEGTDAYAVWAKPTHWMPLPGPPQ